ncbi:MAG TPA: type II CAAX endopeptidase family protein [Xanthobacteraceae bacterium]|nr:type II CAAX endopeptidase family protein [Xanthobacteraceae bacterium]
MQDSDRRSRDPQPALPHWGLWRTFLWTLGTLAALELTGGIAILIWQAAGHPATDADQDGAFFAFVGLISTPFALSVVVLAAYQKAGRSAPRYLGLALPTFRQTVIGAGWLLLTLVASDLIALVSDQPLVTGFQIDTWRSARDAGCLPALVLLILLASPVFEEILFRGFLLEELAASAMGPLAAIVVTAILWTLLHVQYDWHVLVQIFVSGLLLGSVRLWSGSTLLAILLHVLMNIYATVETIAYAS